MKIILLSIFILASLFANKATIDDVLGGKDKNIQVELRNGDAVDSPTAANKLIKVSLWLDINDTNIQQFAIVNTTTLATGNVNGDIILKDIKYDGRTPSYAKITSTHLIFVFDTNDTAKAASNGSLVIGAGILRDGAQGGALNDEITVVHGKIDDKAYPVFASYETEDSGTADGKIDKINLTFSEVPFVHGDANKSFSVTGYHISGHSKSGSTIKLTVAATSNAYDTDKKPVTIYTKKTEGNISDSVSDTAGNFTPTISTIVEKDTAKPFLVYVGGQSIDGAGDKIYLGFSEKIKNNLREEGRVTLLSGATTTVLTNATFDYTPNTSEKNITITLNEKIDGAFIPNGGKPKVRMEHNATDINDNNFTVVTAGKESASGVAKEIGAPKLSSIERVEDENKLRLRFSEPMSDSVKTAGNYAIASVYVLGGTPASITGTPVQSEDKMSVVLSINNFPTYSTSEKGKRNITIKANPAIKDLVGNAISTVATEHNATHPIGIDKVAPVVKSFKLNMRTGKLDISFDEKMAVKGFNPAKVDISISSIDDNKTLTPRSTATYSGNEVNISLNGDLDLIKHFIGSKTDVNLSIRASSGIVDFASNGFKGGNVSGTVILDNTAPKLVSWEYNLDTKKFKLLFNEAMKIGNYSADKLVISDKNESGKVDVAMTPLKSSAKVENTYPFRTVEIDLLASQVNTILATAKVGEDINQTVLTILAGSGLTDSFGHSGASTNKPRAKTYKSSQNAVATLKVIPNRWNHISVDNNTTSNDILSTGKVSYIYGHDGTKFVQFPATLSSHKGYWIKTSNFSGTEFSVPAIRNIQGTKEDDLNRIRNSEAKLNLIGIDHDLTYEEIRAKPDTKCKYKRIHHYVSDATLTNEGWDVNESVSANDALWVLCIK